MRRAQQRLGWWLNLHGGCEPTDSDGVRASVNVAWRPDGPAELHSLGALGNGERHFDLVVRRRPVFRLVVRPEGRWLVKHYGRSGSPWH